MKPVFGITMRVTEASGYLEIRDTIARDWSNYMLSGFPDSKWLFIPNIGKNVIEYIKGWGINVLVLSGGDDIGLYEDRDKTETILLKYALKNNIPIIGVCRGMQLIHTYFGGKIVPGDTLSVDKHRAKRHLVQMGNTQHEVNSYHTNFLDETSLGKNLHILARCTIDNTVEGIENDQLMAIMWHPERETILPEWNQILIKKFLKKCNIEE